MFNKKCNLTDQEIHEKADQLLKQMTLKEKVWLLNGNWYVIRNTIKYKNPYNPVPIETNGCKRLGVSPVKFTDGPRGVVMGHSTCFPVSMARGASFDRELEKRVGDVIGKESRAQGANLFAGVCINLLRHPAWGRAQETYGEEPFHVGEMGKALTESVQEHNVMACIKHYAVNSIENSRFEVDVKADDRTLHEVYLPHFKKSVDAGAASVMGAYNRYDSDHCCESKKLLTDILRNQWGFEGFTLSDFTFGIRNTNKAIEAGMDMEMPLPLEYQEKLLNAVQTGEISEDIVDMAVKRVLRSLLVFENTPDKMEYHKEIVACKEHTTLSREVAEKSMVLIKNENNVLPFSKGIKKILVVGELADKENTGDKGSSKIDAPYVVTPLEGLKNYFGNSIEIIHVVEEQIEKAEMLASEVDCVIIIAGYNFNDEGEYIMPLDGDMSMQDMLSRGYRNQGQPLRSFLLKNMPKRMVSSSNDYGTGGDRSSLSLNDKQIEMINAIGRINPNTVVSLVCGSMVMTREWDDNVPSILYSWYSGMEGGNALPRILFGDVNPSGKLPFTIPTDERHLPYFSSTDNVITYDLYHGYTLLDKNNIIPAYPFGHGLSYTTFEYSNLTLNKTTDSITVKVDVSNTGLVNGSEVIQVYIGMDESMIERHKKLLKGFDKVFIKAGDTKQVDIKISIDDLRYYSNEQKTWILEHGKYKVMVGGSSDEKCLLNKSIEL